jgi:nicotinamidase-related amidase
MYFAPPRIAADNTTLLIVDVQEKLLPLIPETPRLMLNAEILIDVARLLDVPIRVTEQYPQGLGPTAEPLAAKLPQARPAKKAFSCCGADGLVASLDRPHRPWVLLAGIETHVCVSQTAFDLLAAGFHVILPADALASRFTMDHDYALQRLRTMGAVVTTVEAVTFEWVRTAGHPEFKAFSKLVQERARKLKELSP